MKNPKNQEEYVTITEAEYNMLTSKASQFDKIDNAVAEFYDESEEGLEDMPEDERDLCNIGEKVASILGWL